MSVTDLPQQEVQLNNPMFTWEDCPAVEQVPGKIVGVGTQGWPGRAALRPGVRPAPGPAFRYGLTGAAGRSM